MRTRRLLAIFNSVPDHNQGLVRAAAWVAAVASISVSWAAQQTGGPHEILLRSRRFVPPEDRSSLVTAVAVTSAARPHVILQFHGVPGNRERRELEGAGVKLLDYLPRNAFLASVPRMLSPSDPALAAVRWIGPLTPEDRIAPSLLEGKVRPEADGRIKLDIRVFDDEDPSALAGRLRAAGYEVVSVSAASESLIVVAPAGELRRIASEDALRWIAPAPPRFTIRNDQSRLDIRADPVAQAPYSLSGGGVNLGIWDASGVYQHPDFGSRLTRIDALSKICDSNSGNAGTPCRIDSNCTGGGHCIEDFDGIAHATHVAGTMAGDGSLSEAAGGTPLQWKGVASGASIVSYDFNGDLMAETREAIARLGKSIELSQNSWSYTLCPSFPACECFLLGEYNSLCRDYDKAVRGSQGKRIAVIFAAGNDRSSGICGNPSYGSLVPPGTSKNVIDVGAINSDDDSMTDFSAWGPTLDGRVKPDLTAPGCSVSGIHVTSTYHDSRYPSAVYAAACGTSMAAPAVSGSAALVWQQYRKTYRSEPLPSTVKALLIHTAKDLDSGASFLTPGPDYASGYGRLDVQRAVDRVIGRAAVRGNVANGAVRTFTIYVPDGAAGVRATLVWDDPAGAENSALELVNDLDLVAIDPDGTRHYPWTLDPTDPSAPAVRSAEDHTNNVEQVWVEAPYTPGTWTFQVVGNQVPFGPQKFSLVVTPDESFSSLGLDLPAEQASFAADSPPPEFDWTPGALNLLRFKVQWSGNQSFSGTPITSGATPLATTSFTPSDPLWVSILKLGLPSGKIYWRVTGTDMSGLRQVSEVRSFSLAAATQATFNTPVDGASFSKSDPPPLFSWDSNGNSAYRVVFSAKPYFNDPRRTSGDTWLRETSWTPGPSLWSQILGLSSSSSDGQTVYYRIVSRDRLGRVTTGTTRTFTVTPA